MFELEAGELIVKGFIKKIKKCFFYCIIIFKIKNKKVIDLPNKNNSLDNIYKKRNIQCFVNSRKFVSKYDLSIIVPLYNSEKFIANLLNILVNQISNYSYEVILVDDGSIDNTFKIVSEYRVKYSKKIKVFKQKNCGISVARNVGINNANGKYIGFIDHDDFVSEFYVDKLLNIAYDNDADIVKCGTANIKNGRIISKISKPEKKIFGKMNDSIFDYPSYIWGGIYKASLLSDVQFPEGCWYEDMITRIILYRKSKVFVNISEVLHYRNIHSNQANKKVWSNKDYKCLNQLYLIETLVTENDKHNLDNDVYLYLNVLHECSCIMLKRIKNIDDEIKKQVFIRVYDLLDSLYKDEYDIILKKQWKIKSDIIRYKRYDLWLLEENL